MTQSTVERATELAVSVLQNLADCHDWSGSEADAMDFTESAAWHDARRQEVKAMIMKLREHFPDKKAEA